MRIEVGSGRYVQEKDAVRRLCADLRGIGHLFVCGGEKALRGVLPQLKIPGTVLYRAILTQFAPSWREAGFLAKRAGTLGCQAILGVGGGCAMDMAKAIAEQAGLPLFLLPTTAATCAAATRLIALYDGRGRRTGSAYLSRPVFGSYADEALLAKAPARTLAAGIADSLAKLSETASARLYGNNPSTPLWEAQVALAEHIVLQQFSFARDALAGDGGALSRVLYSNLFLTAEMTRLGTDRKTAELAHCFVNALSRLPRTGAGAFPYMHGEAVGVGVLLEMRLAGEIAGIGEEQLRHFLHETLSCPTTLGELVPDADGETVRTIAADMAESSGLDTGLIEQGIQAVL